MVCDCKRSETPGLLDSISFFHNIPMDIIFFLWYSTDNKTCFDDRPKSKFRILVQTDIGFSSCPSLSLLASSGSGS